MRSAARAYDAIAPKYEAQLEQNPVAGYMRARLHAHLGRTFRAGARVLDLTAGTGADARLLAARGIQVTALDASAGMIAELRRAAPEIDARVLPAGRLADLALRDFDGALSTFGGLNTIEDLPRLARDLNGSLRPGGRVILHALNEFCLWQGKRRAAREVWIGGMPVMHHLYNPRALWQQTFARYFELREVYALSVVAAPELVRRFPRLAPALFVLDRLAGRVFPAMGDFFVLEMERRVG
jgi:SAM-dependent methyltransferase